MTLQTLHYVIVIAKYKSFSQAAKSLYLSQSTLSLAVKDLEDELGIRIFLRNNRGVDVTVEGEDFITYAKDILDRSNLLALRYKDHTAIQTCFSVSTQHLPYAIRAFQHLIVKNFPNKFDIAIRETATSNVLYDVSTGKSEIGVLAISESHMPLLEKAFQTYHLEFVELAKLSTYVFLRRQHALAKRSSICIGDLQSYPFVTYEQADSPKYYTEEALLLRPFEKTIHVSDRASKLLLIRNTDAFSIGVDLPNFNTDIYFSEKETELVAIPLADESSTVTTGYIHQQQQTNSDICSHYILQLKKQIAQLQLPQLH